MGEDRVWVRLLQRSPSPFGLTRAFWEINDRNPLSPWWYGAVRPLVLDPAPSWGLYACRLAVSAALAVSVFILADELGRRRRTRVAFLLGLGVLLWDFSGYYEQITWNFYGGLTLVVLSVWSYVRYLDSGRTLPRALAASLVLHALAIGTYTIHCGAPLAVFLLALARPPSLLSRRRLIAEAVVDAAGYAVLLGAFVAIWITTSRPTSTYYALSLGRVSTQLLASLRQLLWHDDFTRLGGHLVGTWHIALVFVAVAGGAALVVAVLRVAQRGEPAPTAPIQEDRAGAEEPGRALTLGLAALALAVAVPTVALESTSAVWLPGYRARMIHQLFEPVVGLLGLAALGALVARWRGPSSRDLVLTWGLVTLCTAALVIGVDYNRTLCALTANERALRDGIAPLLERLGTPAHVLVQLDERTRWPITDEFSDTYIQTWFWRSDVHMRVLSADPPPDPGWARWWRVELGEDDVGVRFAAVNAGQEAVPWSHVALVRFDGERVSVPALVTAADLEGLQVDLRRAGPILQAAGGRAR